MILASDRRVLLMRTLRIDEETWTAVMDAYRTSGGDGLDGLAHAYAAVAPHAHPMPASVEARPCPVCACALAPAIACRPGPFVYGRCTACGHGALLLGARTEVYATADYFLRRDEAGVGYDGHASDRGYREEKGRRLSLRLREVVGRPHFRLLEVGSGFGFTRQAARRLGIQTEGVDPNPHAVAEALRLHGLPTHLGTLAQALARDLTGPFDVALYQFVLEHLPDPVEELALVRTTLARGGKLALLVPSMEAAEIDVFGASYRSFRPDHLHLFTRRSIALALERAGFRPMVIESGCNLHLLREFVGDVSLQQLYTEGRGPDLFVIGERTG